MKTQALIELVKRQAWDDGLWFIAQTAPEAYLQQELRRLHDATESVISVIGEITSYVDGLEMRCAEESTCEPYKIRNMRCPECPLYDAEELREILESND